MPINVTVRIAADENSITIRDTATFDRSAMTREERRSATDALIDAVCGNAWRSEEEAWRMHNEYLRRQAMLARYRSEQARRNAAGRRAHRMNTSKNRQKEAA